MRRTFVLTTALTCLVLAANPATAQVAPTVPTMSYADLADLSVDAPLAIVATIDEAIKLKGAQAAGTPPGMQRFYVEATVNNLIRGANGVSATVNYVVAVPLDADGRTPKLKRLRIILLARAVPGRPGAVQLIAPDAQLPWSPAKEQMLRSILTESVNNEMLPDITGVGDAFHVAGTLQGEGETQIFLKTRSGDPVSLSIVRRPGQQPRWAVALSDIVDEAARPPEKNTLLWYHLACFLPRSLPQSSVASLAPEDAAKARADYQVVLQGLGPCGRTRG